MYSELNETQKAFLGWLAQQEKAGHYRGSFSVFFVSGGVGVTLRGRTEDKQPDLNKDEFFHLVDYGYLEAASRPKHYRFTTKGQTAVDTDFGRLAAPAGSAQETAAGTTLTDEDVALANEIRDAHSEADLRDLCFELKLDYDDVPGERKRDRSRELVLIMKRHGRLPDLLNTLVRTRPLRDWGRWLG